MDRHPCLLVFRVSPFHSTGLERTCGAVEFVGAAGAVGVAVAPPRARDAAPGLAALQLVRAARLRGGCGENHSDSRWASTMRPPVFAGDLGPDPHLTLKIQKDPNLGFGACLSLSLSLSLSLFLYLFSLSPKFR